MRAEVELVAIRKQTKGTVATSFANGIIFVSRLPFRLESNSTRAINLVDLDATINIQARRTRSTVCSFLF